MIEAIRYFHASSLMELEQAMVQQIADGWQPFGAMVVDSSLGGWDFYQPMIKGSATTLPSNMAPVTDSLGYPLYGSDGTTDQAVSVSAVVQAGKADRFKLPASAAVVKNGDTVQVRNSAGANGKGSTSVVTAGSVVTGINLAATIAPVANGTVLASLPVTNNAILAIGTANRQVTVNVANGVITGLTIV
ncbi:hypothetical protein CHU32_21090 [Superficieibacter electus]|uniref:DUF1737 domain-containing protein n=1 Tax=Superficieibacter electus TaxID=2022662 RepID=A0A2P5GJY4_9ENTR|nr:hypothetical protein [Superficieibacter electus]POP42146.1 hypothetical protein CHU33_20205 [Superficieibacter electus]POP44454.1 hypothetical protein CHU32_21090 [Superficieibacter electus]